MKKMTFIFTFILALVGYQSFAQYGCASGIPITDGYTATGITSPGNGGPEDWNDPNPSTINMCENASGASLSPNYFDDDVYLFTYTAGANDEEVSMTINSNTTWTGLGIFSSCSGTFLDDCMGSSASTSGGVLTATATVSAGQTVYIAVGQWGTPNALNFDVTAFSAIPLVNPPSCTTLSNPTDGATDVGINGDLTWNAASGGATDYTLMVGTTSGASDVFSGAVGNVTSYNVGALAYSSMYYVTIIPSNANGPATGCVEESFMTVAPPPTGSICSDPILINTLPYSTTDDTSNYGDDYSGSPGASGCGTTSNYLNGDDVIYAYTATSDTAINVSMTPTASWSGIFVYTDCADIGSACVAGIGNSSTNERNFDLNVTNGITYYIVISTYASPQSTAYDLVITENTCATATAVYSVVNDCDSSGGFLIDVQVTDMGSATALTVSDDQGNPSQALTAPGTLQFGPYVNGTDVVITIDDDNDDGSCTVTSSAITQVACPPANDTPNGAIVLTLDEGTACGANTIVGISNAATNDSGEVAPSCSSQWNPSPGNGDLWYQFTAPASELALNVSNISGLTSVSGVLYSGTPGALTEVGTCGNSWPKTYTGLIVSDTYYLRVWDYGNDQIGTFNLCGYYLSCSPATINYSVDNICGDPGGDFNVLVDITDMGTATSLSVEDDQGNPAQIANGVTTLTFGPYANGTDVVITATPDDNVNCVVTSATQIQMACPPANDECANAIMLTPGVDYMSYPVDGSLIGATDSGYTNTCGGTATNDVWYSVVVPSDGVITIETGADIATGTTGNDTAFEVYSGTCGSLTSIDCDDDGAATGSYSLLNLTGLTPDSVIYIRLWGYGDDEFEPYSISAFNPNLSINDFVNDTLFSYYPNPVNNTLSLRGLKDIQNVSVYNMLGQEVLRTAPNTVNSDVDMSGLKSGTYFVKVMIENTTKTIKVIKK